MSIARVWGRLVDRWQKWRYGVPVKNLDEGPYPFSKVLRDELVLLEKRRTGRALAPGEGGAVVETALDMDLTGLAFSGGGIRSATFNLGVLQALAERQVLRRFDYLSTVSGGGYVGSWLTALCHRKRNEPWSSDPRSVIEQVEEEISPRKPEHARHAAADREELPAIRWLRRYSNYLTPKAGFFSVDTWALLTTSFRNIFLNLLVLVSLIVSLIMVPRLVFLICSWLTQFLSHGHELWMSFALVPAFLGMYGIYRGLVWPIGSRHNEWKVRYLTQNCVLMIIILPLLLSAFLAVFWLSTAPIDVAFWRWGIITALIYVLVWAFVIFLVARHARPRSQGEALGGSKPREYIILLSAIPPGFGGGSLLWCVGRWIAEARSWEAMTFGPVFVVMTFVAVGALHTGLLGIALDDHLREWKSRVAAWLLVFSMAWVLLWVLTAYGPVFALWAHGWILAAVASFWVLQTLGGIFIGRSAGALGMAEPRWRALVAAVAPYIFIVGLFLMLSSGLAWVLGHDNKSWELLSETHSQIETQAEAALTQSKGAAVNGESVGSTAAARRGKATFNSLKERHFTVLQEESDKSQRTWIAFFALLTCLVITAWRVDVNEFSMHRLYRNRLVRCYLGASVEPRRRERKRDTFTGFNHEDDIRLGDPIHDDGTCPGPFHLINTTLNLTSSKELAWQERKGASFVLSPLYCGFELSAHEGAYRQTSAYGNQPKMLTLGSALAISGAAASPNMGYHTSPALAFIMTFFDVRLGWWLGNPKHPKTWRKSGPAFGLLNLLGELFALTRENSKFVYLSDGGHFENLGIYELVRRRCRLIVACDAEADPDLTFGGLGNAIRKCRADFGIDVEIQLDPIRPAGKKKQSQQHWAVGTIHYDHVHPGAGNGVLLYLKASLTGEEPEDVRAYAAQNREFPHQTTADQFFDESQFESYRTLGYHVAASALDTLAEAEDPHPKPIAELLGLARREATAVPGELLGMLARRALRPTPRWPGVPLSSSRAESLDG